MGRVRFREIVAKGRARRVVFHRFRVVRGNAPVRMTAFFAEEADEGRERVVPAHVNRQDLRQRERRRVYAPLGLFDEDGRIGRGVSNQQGHVHLPGGLPKNQIQNRTPFDRLNLNPGTP